MHIYKFREAGKNFYACIQIIYALERYFPYPAKREKFFLQQIDFNYKGGDNLYAGGG